MHRARFGSLFVAATLVTGCRPHTLVAFEGELTMHTTAARGEAHDLVVKAKGDKLRFEMAATGAGPSYAVYDPAANKVLLIIDAQKGYLELAFGAPGAPVPNTDPASSSITKVGTRKQVAGYDCEEWSVKDGTGHRSDVCIAQGIAFFDLSRMRPGKPQPESALAREFREHKSFPLESIEFGADGKEISRMEVTSITPKTEPATAFAVPAGYTKLELPR